MTRTAIFPGSFDPFTYGHADIVERSLLLFDKVVIAIGHNTQKNRRYFDIDLMVDKINGLYTDDPRVEVIVYNELTAQLAQRYDARFLVRGLRNTTDFEYENSIAQVNRHVNEDLETVFLITSPKYAYISSTIIREVHRYDGDIAHFLPYSID